MKFTVVQWMVLQAEAVVTREAEFAGPAWMFGSRSYQVLPDGRSVHQPNRKEKEKKSLGFSA